MYTTGSIISENGFMLISICLVIITNFKWVLNGYFAMYKYESTEWNNQYNYKDAKDNIF